LLLKNLSTSVDRATKRFAAELHDGALQKLTGAELVLARAMSGASAENGAASLEKVHSMLVEVEEALRSMLFNVRPPSLETQGGLEETIRDRLAKLDEGVDLKVEIEFDVPFDPPYELKTLLYRQINEAVTNIEKHASASRAHVTLKAERDGVYGAVTDDGRGFIVSERDHLPGHLGLLALNERALLAGGWCKIKSEPGAGTIVEFWVPIP